MAAVTKAPASLAGLIWLTTVAAAEAQDFPLPPPTRSAAEAAGLPRVEAEKLSRDYAGKRVMLTSKSELIQLDLRVDGTLDYADDKGVTDTGSWSVTARDAGTLCRRFSKQMGGRTCDVYFAAPDGVHWFGYDPDTGRWRDTTRAQASK